MTLDLSKMSGKLKELKELEEAQPKNKVKRWSVSGIAKHHYTSDPIYASSENEALEMARIELEEELENECSDMSRTADFAIKEVVDKAFSVSFPTDEPSEDGCWLDGNRVFALGAADEDEARQRIERHIRDAIQEVTLQENK